MSHPTQLETIMTAHPDCDDCTGLLGQISDPSGGIAETTTTATDDDGNETSTRHYLAAHHPETVVIIGKSVGCVQCDRLKLNLTKKSVGYLWIDVLNYETGIDVIRDHGHQQVPFVKYPGGQFSGNRVDLIPAVIASQVSESIAA